MGVGGGLGRARAVQGEQRSWVDYALARCAMSVASTRCVDWIVQCEQSSTLLFKV